MYKVVKSAECAEIQNFRGIAGDTCYKCVWICCRENMNNTK